LCDVSCASDAGPAGFWLSTDNAERTTAGPGVNAETFTPGFVADTGLASELAEIGVILLMFGVGLHFSVDSLLRVRDIALPGAVVQLS
jgi:predicted Kef-type K+ transport protein